MSDTPNESGSEPRPAAAAGQPAAATAAAAASAAAGASQAAEPAVGPEQLKAIIQALQADLEGERDLRLRAQAEMENFRKRLERERADTQKYAIGKFAADIVAVGDNLGLALAAVKAEAQEASPSLKALVEGVVMTDKSLVAILERHGVRRIDPKGETFNPYLHQAVAQLPDRAVPSGTILQVHQAGYLIEDRVLRPAMVVVSQGGPRMPKEPADLGPAATTDEAAPAASSASNPPPQS
jgi:molecular chaperone GrpE